MARGPSVSEGLTLRGRLSECAVIDGLLDGVRGRHSGALVVRGEAGIGKTALLEYATESASDLRIARAVGVESEMELPFAALHQLCAQLPDRFDRLPAPQRDALTITFGLSAGAAPDRFIVSLAFLSLLSEAAEQRPLLCVIDDGQWLDRASCETLGFVARRLLAEPIALLFAVREPSQTQELAELPEIVVGGLSDHDARVMLDSAIRGPMDRRVRDRIVAEARGNPLALLELPRGLTPAELAGGVGLPDTMPLVSRIEESFVRQVRALPDETQRLLLVAAAEPIGDVTLLWRAAELLGIAPDAASPAVTAGLMELGTRTRFRHPLLRSAVCRAATAVELQGAHSALADATDADADPDRRAWHTAQGTVGPDEVVAQALEDRAARVQSRGGMAAAAAFLARATELTPDPAMRATRALAAAQAKLDAAAPEAAFELLATAEIGPLDALQRARLERLRAQLAFATTRGSDAPPRLLVAAKRLEQLDAGLARETYLDAFGAAIFAGRESVGRGVAGVADAARRGPSGPRRPRPLDLLLDGLVTRFTETYAAAVAPLRRALEAYVASDDGGDEMRALWLACRVATDLWDDELWHELATRAVRVAREAGHLSVLPIALTYRGGVHAHAGEFDAAAGVVAEADAISEATGNAPLWNTSLMIAAWRGREGRALELIKRGMRDAAVRGEGRAIGLAHYATAVLYNGLGRYEDAFEATGDACAYEDLGLFGWALIERVEAAVRIDDGDVAQDALRRLCERTRVAGTDWALGIEARSRALVSDGDSADAHYREAIERLRRTRIAVHLARAHLAYGEWLRRERRRGDAREQLRTAFEMFTRIGADGFAARAEHELLATGERVRKRSATTHEELTTHEAQVARLARDGLSNPEIGERLFISPHTVAYHLRKVFSKLDITSRGQLARVLPERAGGV